MMDERYRRSPLAPAKDPVLEPVKGVATATATAGIKYRHRPDVLLMQFSPETAVAGVFTRSKCAGAPVEWCRSNIKNGRAKALLVNSGNANAFTGELGRKSTQALADMVGSALGCEAAEVFLASTGVIGEPLDIDKFAAVVPGMVAKLKAGEFDAASRSIMTTDTFPKGISAKATIGDATVQLTGIAKGSGMIAPDMATTLAFIVTDADIAAPVLQALLSSEIEDSFNAITVDSDTSTSDTVLVFATGQQPASDIERISTPDDPRLENFRSVFRSVLLDLALQVIKDGEGARKFITVRVTGALSKVEARAVALSVANSPLVKCAVGGEDANWGRIAMAVGKSGNAAVERDRIAISFGSHLLAFDGMRAPDYDEEAVSAYMKNSDIVIQVDLGLGAFADQVYTCDLTDGYVAINGNYRS